MNPNQKRLRELLDRARELAGIKRRTSLPLMGISNSPFVAAFRAKVFSSLPLMGISNTNAGAFRCTDYQGSLPLMGISNL